MDNVPSYDYEAEVKRRHVSERRYRSPEDAPRPMPAEPLHEQIRTLSQDVADAAGRLTECRDDEREAGKLLAEAEQRFAEAASRLAQAMERHRMDGMVDTEKGRP